MYITQNIIRQLKASVKYWVAKGGTLLLVFLTLSIATSSCRSPKKTSKEGVIVVSIEPLRYFTEQISGGRYEVISIVPSGYSPEMYEPTPQQLISASGAKAYIKIGQLGFEKTWLEKISENEPKLAIWNTSDSLGKSMSGLKMSTFDPHTWTSPRNAVMICRSICSNLCQMDSVKAPLYKKNLATCIQRIHLVDVKIHKLLENVQCRTFVTAHPTLSYFASDYGLRQLSIEKDGKEPTPQELAELIRQCKQEKVQVILVQPEFNRSNAMVLARETGAHIVNINPLNYHWDQEMIQVAKAIKYGK